MEKRHITQILLHNKVLLTAVILLTLTVAGIIIGLSLPEHKPTIQGQLDTTDYRVSTKVPSRVVRLCVKEGDRVHRGDTIVILSAPEVNAMESEAKSKHAVTVANDELVREGTRRELISSSYDRYQQAVAHADICEKTYRRVEALYSQGVASAQKRDEAKAAYDAATAAAQALKQEYDMAVNGARREEKVATAAAARGAAAKVEEVKALVNETVLTAPMDGVVTEVFVEPGEFVGIGAPIINVETEESWFTFYVTEDKLQNFDYGTVVNVYRPASGDTVAARITRINNAGDFAAWKATRALEDLDLKVFDIRATPIKKIQHPHEGESAVLLTQE